MFRELCGDTTLRNVVLVTNMWSEVTKDIGDAREKELSSKYFRPVLAKGAQIIRHHDTAESAQGIVRMIMKNHLVVLQIQRELVDEEKEIVDTAAGEAINQELNDRINWHQAELKKVREDMEQAVEERDERTIRELEEERKKLQGQMDKIKKDSEGMAEGYAAEKRRMEAKIREMDQERKRTDTEHKRHLADLTHRLQDQTNASAAERVRLEQEIERLRNLVGTQVLIPADEPPRYSTYTPRARGAERADPRQRQLPPIPPRTPSPQVSSHLTPYVRAFFLLATME